MLYRFFHVLGKPVFLHSDRIACENLFLDRPNVRQVSTLDLNVECRIFVSHCRTVVTPQGQVTLPFTAVLNTWQTTLWHAKSVDVTDYPPTSNSFAQLFLGPLRTIPVQVEAITQDIEHLHEGRVPSLPSACHRRRHMFFLWVRVHDNDCCVL